MSPKNMKGAARPLTPEMLQQLAQGLQTVHKNTQPYRGQERFPLISFKTPAYGRLLKRATALLADCAEQAKLGTRTPGALRVLKNNNLPGYIVMEPVVTYDPNASDQYPLKWGKGNSTAYIDLLAVLQPVNMEVPRGFVMEIPLSLEKLPNVGSKLILHLTEAETRAVDTAEEETAASEQEE